MENNYTCINSDNFKKTPSIFKMMLLTAMLFTYACFNNNLFAQVPTAPVATSATNITCTSFNANWGAVSGALTYYIDVSTNATFATFLGTYANLNVGNVTTFTITGLSTNNTYYYRLRAENGNGASLNSSIILVNITSPVLSSTLAPPAICSGSAFNYSPTSTTPGASFTWTRALITGIANAAASGTGNPNETLVNTSSAPVNVTYSYTISANGCTNPTTFNVVVTVNPNAVLSSTLTPPAIFTGNIFSYTPTSATPGATFSWTRVVVAGISNLAGSGAGDPNEILNNTTGNSINVTYVFTLTANGCTNPTTYNIIVTVNPPAVWPGDANNDSLVNNTDLLAIGLNYSQTGAPRTSISNTWQASPLNNWGPLQTNGQDLKHADCNGDGTIDANDTVAINLNFNSTHAIVAPVNNYTGIRTTADMYFVISGSIYNAGDWVNAELWLGTSVTPVSTLYGIAFNINYDGSIVQSGTESISYPNSWLGTIGLNALKIGKVDGLANTAYGAICRIDHADVSGFGKIADFKFQIKTSLTSLETLNLSFSGYSAINSTGLAQLFNAQTDSIAVNQTLGIQDVNNTFEISISPNPFTSQTTISFTKEMKNASVKIIDIIGKEVKNINFSGRQLIIDKGTLNAGVYFVQVVSEKLVIANEKIIIR